MPSDLFLLISGFLFVRLDTDACRAVRGVISNAKAISELSVVAGPFVCIGGRASAATEHRALRLRFL